MSTDLAFNILRNMANLVNCNQGLEPFYVHVCLEWLLQCTVKIVFKTDLRPLFVLMPLTLNIVIVSYENH